MKRRNVLTIVAMTLVFLLGVTAAVSVAGSASALGPPSTTDMTTTGTSPADQFLALNGTVNAASDHEIVGSSAFPNFTTGAVDNYYSMAHAHVDNSPFAEGTASPLDTGPIGQTAAAGNFQQSQYADARWPGGPDKASFGSQGGPFAEAAARTYLATADASEPTNGLSSPGFRMPAGFDLRLEQVLAAWKATWLARLAPTRPALPPVPTPKITVPKAPATPPAPTLRTPIATVTTPRATAGGTPAPPVTVPSPPTPRTLASASASGDGESLLTSSTKADLVPLADIPKTDTLKADTTSSDTTSTDTTKTTTTKAAKPTTYALVTSGESSLGRVSMGGGQIVIEGIHVTASISNDGSPAYSAAVSIASASIGGIPVTIDQNGVHIAGQGSALPFQQASDALNSALKQAGIQLFLVGPQITTNSCGQSGTGSGAGMPTSTSTTSSDQSAGTSSCGQFGMSSSCDQTGGGSGTGTGTGTTTTTAAPASPAPPLPGQTGTTSSSAPPPSCAGMGSTPGMTSSCSAAGTGTGATTASNSSTATTTTPSALYAPGTATTTTTGPSDQMGSGTGMPSSTEVILTATGLHVVFTQPVSPSGVPAQYVEHILGEVFVDSLATPAGPVGPLPNLGLNSSLPSSPSSTASTCGGRTSASGSGASISGGGSSAGGSGSSGSLSPSGSAYGSSSQPTSGSIGRSLPAAFASALHKPLWLLLAYLLWQSLVVGTALSLWNWRRGGAT